MRRQGSALADAPRHLSDLAQRVEELSERTERDVVSFVAVAKDLRHASEMLLQESNLLREVQVAQSLRSDAIEHALFAQRRQLDRLEAVLATQATQNEGLHQRVVELTTAMCGSERRSARAVCPAAMAHTVASMFRPAARPHAARSILQQLQVDWRSRISGKQGLVVFYALVN